MDNLPTRPAIDRDLVTRDLARLTDLLTPAVEARLEALRTLTIKIPILGRHLEVPVGAVLADRLRGYPRTMTSDALGRLLRLSDDELAALVDGLGRELGAWRGYNDPLSLEDVAAMGPAYDHLLAELD